MCVCFGHNVVDTLVIVALCSWRRRRGVNKRRCLDDSRSNGVQRGSCGKYERTLYTLSYLNGLLFSLTLARPMDNIKRLPATIS